MKIIYYAVALLCPFLSNGQNLISQRVAKAADTHPVSTYTLLSPNSQSLKDVGIDETELSDGLVVQLSTSAINRLQQEQPEVVNLQIPLPELGLQTVTLIPSNILRSDFVLLTSSGQAINYQPGLYYHGILDDDPNSLVAISIFDKEIHGLISTNTGNYVIGKLDQSAEATHLIYNDRHLLGDWELGCEMADDGEVYKASQLEFDHTKAVGDCIRLYIEIDDDIVTDKGGAVPATNYITGLFNESITLYANENLEMGISEILAWDTPAPYSGSTSSAMLDSYQANTGAFNGDLSHLVSYQASGGIAAGFSGICNSNPDNSKCFSSIDATYATVPTYSWSVMVVTHEMGHLIGSRHTHACVWNGNGTAIDGCYTTEGSCSRPGIPSNGGTIMSYCHLQSVGINLNNGFGPQPGNVIRNTVANASCLPANCGSGGPTCSDGIQNGDETGVDCGGSSCPACPTPCTDNEVVVTINLDNYPEETSWQITNASGSVMASGGTYGSQPDGSTVSETVCLVDGCYDFTIFDSYGDGICCSYGNGSYTVTGPGGTLASGGAFGSSETTNFCFGGSGPTCDDGIQNGDETGVDCGGSTCPACPAGGEILGSYFETGWDGWQDGGGDCYRYRGSRSYEGDYSIRIRDNSGTASAMTSPTLDLSGYSSIDVTFFFYSYSMENGEDFWLRYYDGSSWTTVASWAQGSSFNNNSFYTATVTIDAANYNFANNSAIRFQCDASGNQDHIYIDAVTVTANTSSLPEAGPRVTTTELKTDLYPEAPMQEYSQDLLTLDAGGAQQAPVVLFPNPARELLTVRTQGRMASIRILSATGQQLQQLSLENNQHQLDISQLAPGLYYLLIEVDGELKPQRFVKE
ncbi:MAG: T9SS C-terminal target domain-containing protein [Bacteroidetes bacterium]|nr:MAG: T9SS C-terminal target domain-containing protein [Bacteroidota bacterium]